MTRVVLSLIGAVGLAIGGPAVAQTAGQTAAPEEPAARTALRSPILTIDVDRLFGETLFGRRVVRELTEARDALAAENARIAAELTTEERSLARRRPEMEVAAFRAEAEAFDTRVQRIRAEQDAKERALQQGLSEGRDAFLAAASPVLGTLMMESGAAVILDGRSVFLAVAAVDITDEAVAAIDAEIGEGAGTAPSAELPEGVAAPAAPAEEDAAVEAGPVAD